MQDISNVPILPNIKRRIEEELGKSAGTRDQDFLEHIVATNHQYMMFFTQKGNVSGCVFMKFRRK
jgi:hypothetical protein